MTSPYAHVSSSARKFRKAIWLSRQQEICNFLYPDSMVEAPKTEADWDAVFRIEDNLMEKQRKRQERIDRKEAEMWLAIYAPGTKYDPVVHYRVDEE